jgi:hypothetical protein
MVIFCSRFFQKMMIEQHKIVNLCDDKKVVLNF